MASRNVSPGGALLRSSRMFAMPAPLPRPSHSTKTGMVYESDTATTLYPTHLAVTTPATSLAKGDWGFKRPLPLRSTTKSSTPVMKVNAVDTWEHITEYRSGADHALNLEKFQEMNITLTIPGSQHNLGTTRQGSTKSVFEKEFDDISTPNRPSGARWKFDGPWLASMNEAEFNDFLQTVVKRRKHEFTAFLKEEYSRKLNETNRQVALDKGVEAPPALAASDVTDEKLLTWVRELRHSRRDLMEYIRAFLDLAPAPKSVDDKKVTDILAQAKGDIYTEGDTPYAERGPPKTHPSAGLSYNRTSAFVQNHPYYGPQEHHEPFQSRVLIPKTLNGSGGAKLGLGGFVAKPPAGLEVFQAHKQQRHGQRRGPAQGISYFDPDKEGGHKFWVHPLSAVVSPEGGVVMELATGDNQAVAVKTGQQQEVSHALKWFYSQKPGKK